MNYLAPPFYKKILNPLLCFFQNFNPFPYNFKISTLYKQGADFHYVDTLYAI